MFQLLKLKFLIHFVADRHKSLDKELSSHCSWRQASFQKTYFFDEFFFSNLSQTELMLFCLEKECDYIQPAQLGLFWKPSSYLTQGFRFNLLSHQGFENIDQKPFFFWALSGNISSVESDSQAGEHPSYPMQQCRPLKTWFLWTLWSTVENNLLICTYTFPKLIPEVV